MKDKHVVMMVLCTIISYFIKPFYYRSDYTPQTNHYLQANHLYPILYTQTLDMDTFVENKIPLSYLPYYLLSNYSFVTLQTILPLLIEKYDHATCMQILALPEQDAILLSQMRTFENLSSFLQEPSFKLNNFARYLWSQKQHPTFDLKTILNHVNNNQDLILTQSYSDFYQNIQPTYDIESLDVLVNKQYFLPKSYIPSDLSHSLRLECYQAISALLSDASEINYHFTIASSYRSYTYQEQLYTYYLQTHSQEETDSFSCRAGFSEHQTGLTIDLAQTNHAITEIASYIGYPWLQEHAHLYGFIVRYPKDKDMITGIHYEPWHLRYVGISLATLLYENHWTLEEYHELYKDIR